MARVTSQPLPTSFVVLRGRLVTPDALVEDGAVVVDGAQLRWVGAAAEIPEPWRAGMGAPTTDTLLPGLVDIHCHGGGGASFPDATTAGEVATAAGEHLRHGTTSLVGSLVTAAGDVLVERAALLADAVQAGVLVGIHAEGPFLSHDRRGAQSPAHLVPGDPALVRRLVEASRAGLVTMTVAPEIAGVVAPPDDVMAALVAGGAVPSIGHTDASAEQAEVAIARAVALVSADPSMPGRRPTATHLFNGMRPLHHRDPGPVAACLAAAARGELVVELVADGTHLADATVRTVFDLVGPDAIALVTDAMAAAGMPDGDYRLGPMDVRVAGGVARIVEADGSAGSIAGGTAHLLDVVRCTVGAGVPLVDAVRAASVTPADVLGRRDLGSLVAGHRADLVVVDDDLRPRRVMRRGAWLGDGD
ncbi:MAG TPA: amidohydrolase family protein [Cellulomonas sp.]